MNILHVSNTPLSNAPSNLAKIQRDAGHDSRLLLDRQRNTNKIFVGGELWKQYKAEQLVQIFEQANIIHLHNYAWTQNIFVSHPQLAKIAQTKKCLIQYHSPRGLSPESTGYYPQTNQEGFEDTIADPFFKGRRAVVAQYQVRQYPEAEFAIPNVIPIWDELYRPIPRDWSSPVVSFAPSNTNLKGWDDKGYNQVAPLLNQMRRQGGCQIDVIVNTPYEEAMLRKKNSTIGLEEVVTGSYHLSFLEYMSFGCATIGNMDMKTKEAMARVVGPEAVAALPYEDTNLSLLQLSLIHLINDPEAAKIMGGACRKWMETYWAPDKLAKYVDNIYSKI